MTKEELQRVIAIVSGQKYYPDTNIGKRQQWVKDEIARKLKAEFGG